MRKDYLVVRTFIETVFVYLKFGCVAPAAVSAAGATHRFFLFCPRELRSRGKNKGFINFFSEILLFSHKYAKLIASYNYIFLRRYNRHRGILFIYAIKLYDKPITGYLYAAFRNLNVLVFNNVPPFGACAPLSLSGTARGNRTRSKMSFRAERSEIEKSRPHYNNVRFLHAPQSGLVLRRRLLVPPLDNIKRAGGSK